MQKWSESEWANKSDFEVAMFPSSQVVGGFGTEPQTQVLLYQFVKTATYK